MGNSNGRSQERTNRSFDFSISHWQAISKNLATHHDQPKYMIESIVHGSSHKVRTSPALALHRQVGQKLSSLSHPLMQSLWKVCPHGRMLSQSLPRQMEHWASAPFSRFLAVSLSVFTRCSFSLGPCLSTLACLLFATQKSRMPTMLTRAIPVSTNTTTKTGNYSL